MSKAVSVEILYTAGGKTWPVSIEHLVEGQTLSEFKVNLTSFLVILSQAGFEPAPPRAHEGRVKYSAPVQGGGAPPSMKGADVSEPVCPDHDKPMRPSRTQNKTNQTFYYCPAQGPQGGYCSYRAVKLNSGEIKILEGK